MHNLVDRWQSIDMAEEEEKQKSGIANYSFVTADTHHLLEANIII
jgi:hypothetical protein